MQSDPRMAPVSKGRLWAGRIIGALVVLFLVFDGGVKVMKLPQAVDATTGLGFPADMVLVIGIVQLLCLALHLIPRTAILGALLLTGYLGGAVAINLRAGMPLFGNVLFPVYFGLLLWGGLYLRDGRLRALLAPNK